jgi:phage tail-like protein
MADDDVKLTTEEYWSFEIGGTQVPHMTSISIPTASFSSNDFRHENAQAKAESTTVTGTVNFGDITGTRIMDEDTTIQDWFAEGDAIQGNGGASVTKKEAVLYLRDADAADVKKWSMTGVWITSYHAGGHLDAAGGTPLMESFTLHFDHMSVE